MSFSTWKKRSSLYTSFYSYLAHATPGRRSDLEDVAAAAYKAGYREAMKVAEEIATNAILLRQKMQKPSP
jgi:hypothetical protein